MFTAENQPDPESRKGSGRQASTLVRRALKKAGVDEETLIAHVVSRAFDSEDRDSAQLLKELLSRIAPPLKSTVQAVEFDFPADGTHADKIDAILAAVAAGLLAPDVAVMVAGIVKTALDVRETTELVERLERLEALINAQAAQ